MHNSLHMALICRHSQQTSESCGLTPMRLQYLKKQTSISTNTVSFIHTYSINTNTMSFTHTHTHTPKTAACRSLNVRTSATSARTSPSCAAADDDAAAAVAAAAAADDKDDDDDDDVDMYDSEDTDEDGAGIAAPAPAPTLSPTGRATARHCISTAAAPGSSAIRLARPCLPASLESAPVAMAASAWSVTLATAACVHLRLW